MIQSLSVDDYINENLVHSLHTTESRSFRGCRRRWDWIFHEGYYPTVTAKPLEFGVAYHKAMEVWYDPDMWTQDRNVVELLAQQTFKVECQKQLKAYLTNTSVMELEDEARQDYDERIALGLGMLREYSKKSIELDTWFRPIFVEKAFEVPVTNFQGEYLQCKCARCFKKWAAHSAGKASIQLCRNSHQYPNWDEAEYRTTCWNGLPVTYGGRIDMLAEDLDMRYWIFDWKTAARLSTGEPNAPDDFLWLDDQISRYCWAFHVLGVDVAGFVYHEQKKAFPVAPEPMKSPRLGRLFSTNKQMDCDWETYLHTVRENDIFAYESGLYDEFIEYLKVYGGVFHKRHQIFRTQEELRSVGENVFLEAEDMTSRHLNIYPSAGRFSCQFCAFQVPCLGKNRGEDYTYTLNTMYEKRPFHYYEKPSTDKPDRT